jgi:hypothetical protein
MDNEETPKPESVSYGRKDFCNAIHLLEKAEETKKEIFYDDKNETGIFGKLLNLVNPFKCGS